MIWPFKTRQKNPCQEYLEAKAAKIQADLDHDTAQKTYHEVTKKTGKLEQANQRNHFTESLTRAFREA